MAGIIGKAMKSATPPGMLKTHLLRSIPNPKKMLPKSIRATVMIKYVLSFIYTSLNVIPKLLKFLW